MKRIYFGLTILTFVFGLAALTLSACAPRAARAEANRNVQSPAVSPTQEDMRQAASATPVPVTNTPPPTPTPTIQASATPSPLPSTTASPQPTFETCWLNGGRILRDWERTYLLKFPLTYRVYLPPCYEEHSDQFYPVLYLIHGQSYTDDQWDRMGIDEMADLLMATGEIPPFIIVMPQDRIWTQPSEDGFGEAVMKVLIPLIDQEYRTIASREGRAIGGLSRGASWAIHLGFSQWEWFSVIGAHSPPVFWEDVPYVAAWIDRIPPGAAMRVYMDIGVEDRKEIMDSAVWFEGLLTKKGVAHEWHLFQGAHDENYWTKNIERYLRWYAADW